MARNSKNQGHLLQGGNPGKGVVIVSAAPPVVAGAPVGAQIPAPQVPAEGTTILDISGDPDKSEVVTVSLFVNDIPNPAAGIPRLARARVKFGNAGNSSEFLIDYMRGISFSIATSFLQLSVLPDPVFAIFQGEFGAVAAYGGIAANFGQPQLTMAQGEATAGATPLIPGATIRFPVPVLAESVRVLTIPDEPIEVRGVEPIAGFNRYELNYGLVGLNPPFQIPIANDVRSLDIINRGVNDIEAFRLIWKLAI